MATKERWQLVRDLRAAELHGLQPLRGYAPLAPHRRMLRYVSSAMAQLPTSFPIEALPRAGVVLPTVSAGAAHAHVTDVRFDAWGELLASCSTTGTIALHTFNQLAIAASAARHAPVGPAAPALCASPVFAIKTGRHARALRWNPHADNQLLCAFSSAGEMSIYDIGVGRGSCVGRCVAPGCSGLFDAEFAPKGAAAGSSLVYAGGRDGLLRVWDLRRGKNPIFDPRRALADERFKAGPIRSLAAEPDGQIVHAATDAGTVVSWDVRSIATPLRRCDEIARQARTRLDSLPAIDSIALCPDAGFGAHALLFQLRSGQSGVLCVGAREGGQADWVAMIAHGARGGLAAGAIEPAQPFARARAAETPPWDACWANENGADGSGGGQCAVADGERADADGGAQQPGGAAWEADFAMDWMITSRRPALVPGAHGGSCHLWSSWGSAGVKAGRERNGAVCVELCDDDARRGARGGGRTRRAQPWSHICELRAPPIALEWHARAVFLVAGCADNTIAVLAPTRHRALDDADAPLAGEASEADVHEGLHARPGRGEVDAHPSAAPAADQGQRDAHEPAARPVETRPAGVGPPAATAGSLAHVLAPSGPRPAQPPPRPSHDPSIATAAQNAQPQPEHVEAPPPEQTRRTRDEKESAQSSVGDAARPQTPPAKRATLLDFWQRGSGKT
jgi:hypothetical protein